MCLYVKKDSKEKIAKKDLVFYKVVKVEESIGYNGETYTTPFRYMKIVPGVTYVEKGENFDRRHEQPYIGYSIEGGGFHLYVLEHDAQHCADFENDYLRNKSMFQFNYTIPDSNSYYTVMRAIIPKGTRYIEGFFEDKPSVCAKAIRYEKICV